jgi:hypothetical protein
MARGGAVPHSLCTQAEDDLTKRDESGVPIVPLYVILGDAKLARHFKVRAPCGAR